MNNREKAAFWGLAALIGPAFAPVQHTSGVVVAVLGFLICGIIALVLLNTPDQVGR